MGSEIVGGGLAGLTVWMFLVIIVAAVLWVALPFAVFGLKPLLREIIKRQDYANELLRQISDKLPPPRA